MAERFPDAIAEYALSDDGSEMLVTAQDGTVIRIQAG